MRGQEGRGGVMGCGSTCGKKSGWGPVFDIQVDPEDS